MPGPRGVRDILCVGGRVTREYARVSIAMNRASHMGLLCVTVLICVCGAVSRVSSRVNKPVQKQRIFSCVCESLSRLCLSVLLVHAL